jgi:4-hydroxybenzoate polyprenyltransferase
MAVAKLNRSKKENVKLPVFFVFFSGILCIAKVEGFSARLHRPWDLTHDISMAIATTKALEMRRLHSLSGEHSSTRRSTAKAASTSSSTTALSSAGVPNNNDEDGESTDDSQDEFEAEHSLSPARLFLDSSSSTSRGPNGSSEKVDLSKRVNGAAHEKAPTMLTSLGPLFQLTRPANFPGVILLHLLGSHLALSHTGQTHLFKRILFQTPSMFVVLTALLLTSSTSMLVNDYYDSKLGRDRDKTSSPLVSGRLTLAIVRHFLNCLYAVALLCVAFVPGIPARMTVVVGLMLTFWYTKHMKPLTWIKTLVCSSLISFSPFTSGTAALKVASDVGQGPWGTLGVLAVPSLWRCVAFLFFGVSGREIMMDILDTTDDKLSGVRTIPVKYGRKFASAAAMVCYILSGLWIISGPVTEIHKQIGDSVALLPALGSILQTNADGLARRTLLAGLGSLMLLGRGLQVFKTKGENESVIEQTVNEAQIAMILSLASFI